MTNYTQTAGSADGTKYFQDLALTPANVKNGSLRLRLNTIRFPKVGKKFTSSPDAVSVSPAAASKGSGVTLDVTVTGLHLEKGAAVTFSGANITVNSTRSTGGKDRTLVANITIAAGAATGARNVVVTNSDGGVDTLTAAFTVNT